MPVLQRVTTRMSIEVLCAAVTLCTVSSVCAQDAPDICNQPTPEPVVYVELPIPWHAIASSAVRWVFASVSSPNGVAVLRRARGAVTLQRIIPTGGSGWGTGGSVWGMVLTHDGRLLLAVGEGR